MSYTEAAVTFLGLGLGPETLLCTGVPLYSMEQLGWLLLSLQVGSALLFESTNHAEGSSSRSRYLSPISSFWPPETRPQNFVQHGERGGSVLERCGTYGSAVLDPSTRFPACSFIPAHLTCLSLSCFAVVVPLCLTVLNGLYSLACCLDCDLSWVMFQIWVMCSLHEANWRKCFACCRTVVISAEGTALAEQSCFLLGEQCSGCS